MTINRLLGQSQSSRKVFDDCHAFFLRRLPTQPRPLEKELVRQVPATSK